jgi:hypothetical protein
VSRWDRWPWVSEEWQRVHHWREDLRSRIHTRSRTRGCEGLNTRIWDWVLGSEGLRVWDWGPEVLRSRIWGSVVLRVRDWGPKDKGLRVRIRGSGEELSEVKSLRYWGSEFEGLRPWYQVHEGPRARGEGPRVWDRFPEVLRIWGRVQEGKEVQSTLISLI